MDESSVILVRRSIERVVRSLPTLPTAVSKVVQEANSPDPSPVRLEQHIHTDPALTAQVLRVVNSAYYGLSGQVSNVGQAIVILGFQQVRNLALSVGAIGTLMGRSPAEVQIARRFWRHAAAVTAGLRLINKRVRASGAEADALRVAGLIHDLGRLCVMCSFGELYQAVIQHAEEEEVPIEVAELRLLGMTHAEIGQQIAEHWKLPDALTHLIGGHEGPFDANASNALLALHAVDTLSKKEYFPDRNLVMSELSPLAKSRLGLEDAEIAELIEEMEMKAGEAEDAFGLRAA